MLGCDDDAWLSDAHYRPITTACASKQRQVAREIGPRPYVVRNRVHNIYPNIILYGDGSCAYSWQEFAPVLLL